METILTWTLNKMSDILLHIKEWLGMNTVTTPEKLPSYIVQVIENMELTKVLGVLKKRKGYANIITSGLTSLKSMIEFKDSNGNRQILIQDGTDIKEIEYSGGSYQAPSAISNDNHVGDVEQIYPVRYNGVVRSGAGITKEPIWYGYINRKRYNNSVTIQGKYLENQIYVYPFTLTPYDFNNATNNVSGKGLAQGTYYLFWSTELDGFQKIIPKKYIKNETNEIYLKETINTDTESLQISIGFYDDDTHPRITAIELFIAYTSNLDGALGGDAIDKLTAYRLEHVDLNENGEYFCEQQGTLDYTNQKIVITGIADWLTFNPEHLFLRDDDNDKDYFIKSYALINSDADLEITLDTSRGDAIASSDDGDTSQLLFYSGWYDSYDTSNYKMYTLIYDNYYRRLGAEMYTYLNIPKGDKGLDDHKYKFYVQAGKRGVIVRANGGLYAYYSPPFAYDVYPAQNEIVLLKEPTGAIDIGDDVLIFYKDQTERIAIYDNANIQRVEDYKLFGLTNQKALVKISDYEIFGMDYRGPWLLTERESYFIGEPLEDWWLDKLSDEEKENCVVGYNRLKGWIIYSFPTYSSADYPNGIVFVFDLKAFKQDQRMIPWWILKTDVPIYNLTLAEDLHLLTGSLTKIVDWNNDSEDEVVNGKIKVKLLRHPLPGSKKIWFDRIFLSINLDGSDTATINIYYDESSTAQTVTLNSDGNAILRYIAETLEAEVVINGNDAGDKSEVSELLITGTPRSI